jgi:hypothetical protein
MRARSIVAGWLGWVRWSLCWDSDVARRTLERESLERRPWELS